MSFLAVASEVGVGILKQNEKGIINGVRTSFERFKQGGWTCLGSQAFNEKDLEVQYDSLSREADKVNPDDPQSVANFMNHCSRVIVESERAISNYRSKCSKQNREAYKKTAQNLLNSYLNDGFRTEVRQGRDYDGSVFNYTHYIPKEGYSNPTIVEKPILEKSNIEIFSDTMGILGNDIVDGEGNLLPIDPALYTPGFVAPISGENKIPELEIVKSNGTPTWSVGGSGKTANGVDWHLGAGKSSEDNTIKLALLGLLGLVAYKVLFKK